MVLTGHRLLGWTDRLDFVLGAKMSREIEQSVLYVATITCT
jgi:hypothetical protein